jgi:hypothetical protein
MPAIAVGNHLRTKSEWKGQEETPRTEPIAKLRIYPEQDTGTIVHRYSRGIVDVCMQYHAPRKDVLPVRVSVRSIAIKPEATSSRPWKSSHLLVLPAIPPSNTATRIKGTPARKEKDSIQLCEKTTPEPSEETVRRTSKSMKTRQLMDPSRTQVSPPSPGGKPGNLEDEIFLRGVGL